MWHYSSTKIKILSCTALVFILMLNFAVVSHSLDIDPDHHLHHQCELYSLSKQGLSHSPVILPLQNTFLYILERLEIRDTERLYFAFLARSPPNYVN